MTNLKLILDSTSTLNLTDLSCYTMALKEHQQKRKQFIDRQRENLILPEATHFWVLGSIGLGLDRLTSDIDFLFYTTEDLQNRYANHYLRNCIQQIVSGALANGFEANHLADKFEWGQPLDQIDFYFAQAATFFTMNVNLPALLSSEITSEWLTMANYLKTVTRDSDYWRRTGFFLFVEQFVKEDDVVQDQYIDILKLWRKYRAALICLRWHNLNTSSIDKLLSSNLLDEADLLELKYICDFFSMVHYPKHQRKYLRSEEINIVYGSLGLANVASKLLVINDKLNQQLSNFFGLTYY